MLNDDEKVSIQAYELWCSISDEEMNRIANGKISKGYCIKALDTLYKVIEIHLLNRSVEKEQLEEDSWNNIKAASCLLNNLSQCTNELLLDKIFNLIACKNDTLIF